MYFDSFQDFLTMGGHGLYVWMSYGAFLLIMIWNIWRLRLRRGLVLKAVSKTWARESEQDNESLAGGSSEGSAP